MVEKQTTAALIIIGNEILSGRTHDKNLPFLGAGLNECGVRLMEVRVIPDIAQTIIETVRAMSEAYDYVFTTGGIGPTHDDITAQAVADAFNTPLEKNAEAFASLDKHYEEGEFNEARQKMAYIPVGAQLIPNPVSAAPGFVIENVHVMAGVPRIMQAMFDSLKQSLKGGATMASRSLLVDAPEGDIAGELDQVQNAFDAVEIGSYPYVRQGMLKTNVVIRSLDDDALNASTQQVIDAMNARGVSFNEGSLPS